MSMYYNYNMYIYIKEYIYIYVWYIYVYIWIYIYICIYIYEYIYIWYIYIPYIPIICCTYNNTIYIYICILNIYILDSTTIIYVYLLTILCSVFTMLQRHLGLQSEELLGARDLMPMSDCNLYGNRQVPETYPHNLHYLNIISSGYLDNIIWILWIVYLHYHQHCLCYHYIFLLSLSGCEQLKQKTSLLQPAASNRRLALLQRSQASSFA